MSTFLDLVLNGIALGAAYALVALGFVIIYKATGVINFSQGVMMLFGAYFCYAVHDQWGLTFYPALIVAMIAGALLGLLLERLIMRFLVGQPPFAQLMVTIGILFVLTEVINDVWGVSPLVLSVPWSGQVTVGGAVIANSNLWRIGFAAAAMLAFFAFFRYSNTGLSMRATALDQEAALAQGISARRVYITAWAVAGAVGTLAGVVLTTSYGLNPALQYIALLAFPAMILGGLDSPGGAIVGGLVIGISQNIASKYFPMNGFDQVFPYVVMIAILLIRPFGLWGTKEVRRV
jgi:branched-chain amino acid transport system permease protein